MSEILGNFIAQRFNIIYFDEYAHDIFGVGSSWNNKKIADQCDLVL